MANFFESPYRVVHCQRDPYDVFIGRPSKWGNPYIIGEDGDRSEVITKYKDYMWKKIKADPDKMFYELEALEHMVLGCYCKPEPCHGDVLVGLSDLVGRLKKIKIPPDKVINRFLTAAKKLLR